MYIDLDMYKKQNLPLSIYIASSHDVIQALLQSKSKWFQLKCLKLEMNGFELSGLLRMVAVSRHHNVFHYS